MRTVNGVEKFSEKNTRTSIAYPSGVFAVVNSPESNFYRPPTVVIVIYSRNDRIANRQKFIFRINLTAFRLLFNDFFDINLQGTDLAMNKRIQMGVTRNTYQKLMKTIRTTCVYHAADETKIPAFAEHLVYRYVLFMFGWKIDAAHFANHCIACGNFIVLIASFHVVVALAHHYCYCCCHERSSHAK